MADPRFFTKSRDFTLDEIADMVGGALSHPDRGAHVIEDVAVLNDAQPSNLVFFENRKYKDDFLRTNAGACLIDKRAAALAPPNLTLIKVPNAYKAYGAFANALYPEVPEKDHFFEKRIADSAIIHNTAKISENVCIGANVEIGADTVIGPGAVIHRGVIIGKNCIIGPNATLQYAIVGDGVTIYPGVCIGQRGFGFAPNRETPIKIPQLGRVIIKNDVEIGANTTIDRGAGPDTVIGAGTMIDNMVQIAHNVKIGKGCIIVSQVGISGSTKIGNYCVLGGQAGFSGHLKVGDQVHVAAKAGVMHDIENRLVVGGYPAIPIKQWHRQTVNVRKLANKKT